MIRLKEKKKDMARGKKRKVGRPSEFDTLNRKQLKKLVLAGWDEKQISDFYGVSKMSLTRWKLKDKKFRASLKDWKKEADKKVERSLYERAIGFNYDEVTYEKNNVGGLGVKITQGQIEHLKAVDTYKTKIVTKLIIPDVTAQIFWLKNRQPEQWREKSLIEHSGEIKGPVIYLPQQKTE